MIVIGIGVSLILLTGMVLYINRMIQKKKRRKKAEQMVQESLKWYYQQMRAQATSPKPSETE